MTDGAQLGAACIANIGRSGQRRRLRFGIALLASSVAAGVVLVANRASLPWGPLLFLPLWMGALGVFQAREKT
jgi:hypothetical protein